MKQFLATINDPAGMHARPAGEFVRLVKNFPECSITLDNGIKRVNANSIISILSLGLKTGAKLSVTADGADEESAIHALSEFFENMR